MVKAFVFRFSSVLFLSFFLVLSCTEKEEPGMAPLDPMVAAELIDISYGSDARQAMDVFLPANRSQNTTKVFVWIHGGGWVDGDKDEFVGFKPWLEAVQDNYAYIAINYRLFNISNGSNKFPSQEEDIKTAMAYIQSQLDAWDISDEIILAGGSAGGHLALLHSYKNNQNGLVKAVVTFFPPIELVSFYSFNLFTQLLLDNLLGGNPTTKPEIYADSSPIGFITPNSVPTVFFHGDIDTVVPISQSEMLEDALIAKNVPYLVEYIQGQGHGFTTETYQDLIGKAQVFLDGVLE
jgi:acetyl esterase/lipase